MQLKLTPKLEHKNVLRQGLVLTQQPVQAIRLLQLTRFDLLDQVGQEWMDNPALEEVPANPESDPHIEEPVPYEEPPSREATAGESMRPEADDDDEALLRYLEEGDRPFRGMAENHSRDDQRIEEQTLRNPDRLSHLIEQQLDLSSLTALEKAERLGPSWRLRLR